jgi:hypothetical protein
MAFRPIASASFGDQGSVSEEGLRGDEGSSNNDELIDLLPEAGYDPTQTWMTSSRSTPSRSGGWREFPVVSQRELGNVPEHTQGENDRVWEEDENDNNMELSPAGGSSEPAPNAQEGAEHEILRIYRVD